MHIPSSEAPMQALPHHVQERAWTFVRRKIHEHEARTGAMVTKFEIHVTDAGHLEVEILKTQTEGTAAVEAGLEGE